MKKLSLFCLTLLAALSLSACGKQTSHHSKSASSHSSKVVKHHHKKHSKKKKADKQSSSSATQSSQAQTQSQQNSGDQADPFDVSTWDKPYKGYPNFRAYLQDHPNTPNIQSQTAQMQHDENVRRGIENPDGSETENFKRWEAQQDWDNENATIPDYDPNHKY